jgi:hypothetical protein
MGKRGSTILKVSQNCDNRMNLPAAWQAAGYL